MTGEIKHWRRWLVVIWMVGCAALIALKWNAIRWYALPDTDDNIRMAQVRALLGGQGWYDLRQYKLNPPEGFNIHWSRLVDLPIAGLELLLRPLLGTLEADKWAAALAPLLPLLAAMAALAVAARRLVAPNAFFLAAGLVFAAPSALGMFSPLRVDHHGWQLAMLAWTVAGLVDPDARRGGLTMGISSAFSLVIGLELLPFLAVCGAAVALHWVWDPDGEGARLRSYGGALATGCLLGYLAFASYDNRVWRCDVLSPVWLSIMVAAGVGAALLSVAPLRSRALRLGAGVVLAALLGLGFAHFFPQCLGRPEQISDELYASWFSHIREAKPLYGQAWDTVVYVATLPIIGLVGAVWALRESWGTRAAGAWGPVALVSALSLALCFWQTRNGPAAQILAIPGAVALAWAVLPPLAGSRFMAVRTLGVVGALLLVSSLGVQLLVGLVPDAPPTPRDQAIGRANARCPTLPALAPIARLPATTIFSFVDLGPRIINVTPHRAVAGPYHRNGAAILDVHHAFDGPPEQARAIMLRHGATLLLVCPNMNESTVYQARSPDGFYSRLARGERFAWLEPVALPSWSPYKLWRVR